MSGTSAPPGLNSLQRPLGPGIPLPGGDIVNRPAMRGDPAGRGPIPRNLTTNTLNKMVQEEPSDASGGVGDAPSPQGGMSFDGSRNTLIQQHGRNKAAYEHITKMLKDHDIVRKGLDNLSEKADMVNMEDIVGEAAKLVSQGIDPVKLAGVLADAPQNGGGEALGAWVGQQAATASQDVQMLRQQKALAQHQMGVSAVHLLMAHANAEIANGGLSPPITNSQSGQNALEPPESDTADSPLQMGG